MFLAKSVGGVLDATVRFEKTPMGAEFWTGTGFLWPFMVPPCGLAENPTFYPGVDNDRFSGSVGNKCNSPLSLAISTRHRVRIGIFRIFRITRILDQ